MGARGETPRSLGLNQRLLQSNVPLDNPDAYCKDYPGASVTIGIPGGPKSGSASCGSSLRRLGGPFWYTSLSV